jgi:hypothetical protein
MPSKCHPISHPIIIQFSSIEMPLFLHIWLEWLSTHQCTIQKIPFWDFIDGMKLSPTWSASFYFFPSGPFCPFTLFFSWGSFFFNHVFFGHTPDPKFFFGTSYLPPPTYLPPSLLPTHLPPSTSFSTHLHC